ncbi:hypothetical protein Ddye_020797 [Dipteronia dyeriana]|uniref:RING-type E3 ubiquitin transferase n=1 Tax=Dipteronia dyeriana TaxID=168575 RepID=A0AAD9WX25_9ROSI|nr:hypothetical protein Ddye_020797 [Dipteronia dyeriana]
MNQFWIVVSLLLLFRFLFHVVEAQSVFNSDDARSEDAVTNFKPSLAVVIGILCVMFSLTFFLLIYAKFCQRGSSLSSSAANHADNQQNPALIRSNSRFSGIDKTVIESLPFFRFSSLKGSKQGLECAVCLSKFEEIEILRLLPKCRHAFHINCIDQWLEKHSSCPLCRHIVSIEDPTIFTYSNSMRLMFNQSQLREDSDIELFVQREEEDHKGSSRFSIGSSFRKAKEPDKEEDQILIQVEEEVDSEDDDRKILHKLNHKIIVSDVILKNRWSSASSSDLMFLNSEMLNAMSSNRFSSTLEAKATRAVENNDQIKQIKEEMEMKRLFESKLSTINKTSPVFVPLLTCSSNSQNISSVNTSRTIIDPTQRRSVSEITALSRFQDSNTMKNRINESCLDGNERMRRKVWLPIARRTVQWFADREKRSQQSQSQSQSTPQPLDV